MFKIFLCFFLTSCTCNITLNHSVGQAEDLVDTEANPEVEMPIDVDID